MKRKVFFILTALCCAVLTGCGKTRVPNSSPVTVPGLQNHKETEPLQPQLLQEEVIYNSGGVRIIAKGLEEDTMAGTRIRILVENGTDRNLVFTGEVFVVNEVTMPGYLYAETAAGTKCNDAIELYSDTLEAAGITQVGTVRGYDARIVDTDTYEILARVPLELETAYAQGIDHHPEEIGVELYRDDDVTVTAQVISEEFYGKTARIVVENDSDRDLIAEVEHVSVNGYSVDAWLYDVVCEDTIRYCQLDLFETSLAENGIDKIETITFSLNLLDAETYETVTQTEQLTVAVNG